MGFTVQRWEGEGTTTGEVERVRARYIMASRVGWQGQPRFASLPGCFFCGSQ